jgi:hypothetical protein
MNFVSPLSKDTRGKKEAPTEKKKERPKMSLATTKKILKPLKMEVGQSECRWMNSWVENEIRGACLPLALLGNDFLAELEKTFGSEGSQTFLERLRKEFLQAAPRTLPLEKA